MVVFPNAKINLGLNVLRRRSDGYHEIETCFYPTPWNEALEAIPDDRFSLNLSGIPIPIDGKNIIEKAFDLLNSIKKLPGAQVHLHKAIPIGAGLGGGSADGAFALKLFNELFDLNFSENELELHAQNLGADCAFFIRDQPAFAAGIGEKLTPIAPVLQDWHILMVYPDLHISTKEAYAGVNPSVPKTGIREIIENMPLERWKELLVNDFEKPLFTKYPLLGQIKEFLYEKGAIYASMTGSGSTIFGIFKDQPPALVFDEKFKVFSGVL